MKRTTGGIVLLFLAFAWIPLHAQQGAVIVLNPRVTFQKMTGWEATVGALGANYPAFESCKEELFDLAVSDLGINRVRLEIKSGAENPRDGFTERVQGKLTDEQWRCYRYATVNDNDDPFTINWAGFHFTEFDASIEKMVLPIKKRVEARGEKLFLNVNYVAFYLQMNEPQCPSGLRYLHDNPEEYAEFVLATCLHMKKKYGLVPDAWEMHLEPDNTPYWRGKTIGEALMAAAKRLEANGFKPAFIAPSPTSMANAVPYFDDMIAIPGVRRYLTEFSYHRYKGVSDENLRQIGERAVRYKINTAMLEHIGSGHEDLYKDITVARNSAWAQFVLASVDLGSRKPIDDWAASAVVGPLRKAFQTGDQTLISQARTNANRAVAAWLRRGGDEPDPRPVIEAWADPNVSEPLLQAFQSGEQKTIDRTVDRVAQAVWDRILRLGDRGVAYYTIDARDANKPRLVMNRRTKFLRQYFKFVRQGAQRIEALASDTALEPVAFINTDGLYVVVVKADQARTFSIEGLPAGTYGIKYTTQSRYDVDLPDTTIQANQPVKAMIDGAGVLTVYARLARRP
jgi:hypothetical protein